MGAAIVLLRQVLCRHPFCNEEVLGWQMNRVFGNYTGKHAATPIMGPEEAFLYPDKDA